MQPAEIDEGARRERGEIGVSRGLARSADVAGALQKLRREKQELVASKGAGHDQKKARGDAVTLSPAIRRLVGGFRDPMGHESMIDYANIMIACAWIIRPPARSNVMTQQ